MLQGCRDDIELGCRNGVVMARTLCPETKEDCFGPVFHIFPNPAPWLKGVVLFSHNRQHHRLTCSLSRRSVSLQLLNGNLMRIPEDNLNVLMFSPNSLCYRVLPSSGKGIFGDFICLAIWGLCWRFLDSSVPKSCSLNPTETCFTLLCLVYWRYHRLEKIERNERLVASGDAGIFALWHHPRRLAGDLCTRIWFFSLYVVMSHILCVLVLCSECISGHHTFDKSGD